MSLLHLTKMGNESWEEGRKAWLSIATKNTKSSLDLDLLGFRFDCGSSVYWYIRMQIDICQAKSESAGINQTFLRSALNSQAPK